MRFLVSVLIFIVSVFHVGSIYSQDSRYRPSKELKWRSLSGEVYVIPFFIDTPVGEFEVEEVEYYLNELNKSKEWILRNSLDYPHVDLKIINDFTNSADKVIFLDNVENWNEGGNRKITNNVAQYLNFHDIEDYVSYHNIDKSRSKVVVICFAKKNGRSHAIDFNRSVFSKDVTIDQTVIFCGSYYGTPSMYKTIIHEFLHLFGAWDLYGGEPQDQEKAQELRELYPSSIMLSSRAQEPILDEITAWRIGWNLDPEHSFLRYEPEYEKNMARMAKDKNTRNVIKFNWNEKNK